MIAEVRLWGTNQQIYEFPDLPRRTFPGLPGLLADSLPDRFGNALIDARLATEGRNPGSFSAIERLCYTGTRGMGALEYAPVLGPKPRQSTKINVDALVELASEILTHQQNLAGHFSGESRGKALADILKVGTSAGGARAKAVIAWNRRTNEVRSGQVQAGPGFTYWLLKFDGVAGNKDKEFEDPRGYGVIEFAYSLMAKAAGITMTECRLLEEHGRRHFMTRRFDRSDKGAKLHMQMTINGKRDNFLKADIRAAGKTAGLKQGRAEALLDEVTAPVERWPEFADEAGLTTDVGKKIRQAHRLGLRG